MIWKKEKETFLAQALCGQDAFWNRVLVKGPRLKNSPSIGVVRLREKTGRSLCIAAGTLAQVRNAASCQHIFFFLGGEGGLGLELILQPVFISKPYTRCVVVHLSGHKTRLKSSCAEEDARPVRCQDAAVQGAGTGRRCATVTPDLDGYLVRRARARQVSGK
ncbi:hypothetical protein PGIGA_G00097540 [Pangasianodon gigas]|uniref:Uncharacterized protein n=1 Tax=Pangasianodon gigas TaxID=30993 RepID=A0ACC5XDS4_PANGG|nr:hypothetical protein [Pangasianodon gigas]